MIKIKQQTVNTDNICEKVLTDVFGDDQTFNCDTYNMLCTIIEKTLVYVSENLAEMQQLDIETKDRVDISLKKYEEMKDKIKSLEELLEAYKIDNSHMTDLLLHLNISEKILSRIDPFTVKTKRFDGPFDDIEDSLESGKIRFVISFDVIKEDLLDD